MGTVVVVVVVGMDVGLEGDEVAVAAAHDLDGSHNLAEGPWEIVVAEGGCDVEYEPQMEWAGSGLLEYGAAEIQVAEDL